MEANNPPFPESFPSGDVVGSGVGVAKKGTPFGRGIEVGSGAKVVVILGVGALELGVASSPHPLMAMAKTPSKMNSDALSPL